MIIKKKKEIQNTGLSSQRPLEREGSTIIYFSNYISNEKHLATVALFVHARLLSLTRHRKNLVFPFQLCPLLSFLLFLANFYFPLSSSVFSSFYFP